jgi:hypothetical protein
LNFIPPFAFLNHSLFFWSLAKRNYWSWWQCMYRFENPSSLFSNLRSNKFKSNLAYCNFVSTCKHIPTVNTYTITLRAMIAKTIVWVRFSKMNLVYYNESITLLMTSAMERPIKVEKRLLNVDRGRFIRICVKIDLSLHVVGKFASLRKETCFDSNVILLHPKNALTIILVWRILGLTIDAKIKETNLNDDKSDQSDKGKNLYDVKNSFRSTMNIEYTKCWWYCIQCKEDWQKVKWD